MAFPRPKRSWWNRITRKNPKYDSTVPELSLSPTGVTTKGTVKDNSGNTKNARERVLEQNFIKRILANVENSIVHKRAAKIKFPLDLTVYSRKLSDPDITEEEAILCYNELIAIFMVLLLYQIYMSGIMRDPSKSKNSVLKPTGFVDFKRLLFNIEDNSERLISSKYAKETMGMGMSALGAGVILTTQGILGGATLVAAIAPIFVGGPVLVFGVIGLYLVNKSIKDQRAEGMYKLEDVLRGLLTLMRSDSNKIKMSELAPKLKFWGLKQKQAEVLYTTYTYNSNDERGILYGDIALFLDVKPDDPLAPNEPLQETKLTLNSRAQKIVNKPVNKPVYFTGNMSAVVNSGIEASKAANKIRVEEACKVCTEAKFLELDGGRYKKRRTRKVKKRRSHKA